jgi:hypothetical protein
MLLKEASVIIPRAIGIGLIIYFGLVVPGREATPMPHPNIFADIQVPPVPVPPVYSSEADHE